MDVEDLERETSLSSSNASKIMRRPWRPNNNLLQSQPPRIKDRKKGNCTPTANRNIERHYTSVVILGIGLYGLVITCCEL